MQHDPSSFHHLFHFSIIQPHIQLGRPTWLHPLRNHPGGPASWMCPWTTPNLQLTAAWRMARHVLHGCWFGTMNRVRSNKLTLYMVTWFIAQMVISCWLVRRSPALSQPQTCHDIRRLALSGMLTSPFLVDCSWLQTHTCIYLEVSKILVVSPKPVHL